MRPRAQRPALHHGGVEHLVSRLGGSPIGYQIQAAAREEHGIELPRIEEAFQAQGTVAGRTELIELIGFDHHVLAGSVLIAADDGGGVDGTMAGTVFRVAQALAAIGMEEVGAGHVASADGRIGLEGDVDQAELEQPGPTGPAGRDAGR